MAVRCKFRLNARTHRLMSVYNREAQTNEYRETQTFEFSVVTDGSEEDKAFWAATPVGKLELSIVNPEAARELEFNKTYYVTLTLAE